MARTEKEKARLKNKYDQIYQYIGDSKLANRYKHMGAEKIYQLTGVKVTPDRAIEEKRLQTARQIKLARTRHEKYNMAKDLGYDIEESKKLTRYSKERFSTTKEYRRLKKNGTAKQKQDFWKKVSNNKNKLMPVDVIVEVGEANKKVRMKQTNREMPNDASYGYAVVYWSFALEKTPDEIDEGLTPNLLQPYIVEYPKDKFRPTK